MGRKKKRASDPRSRIFCYYCERNFQTEQMLLTHQREKHLRCPTCHKKMLSVQSLTVHVSQMHNYNLQSVPNALPERSDPTVEVLGMNGVPEAYYSGVGDGTSNKASRNSLEQRHPRQQTGAAWGKGNSAQMFPQQLQYAYQRGNGTYPPRHGSYPQHSQPQYSHAQPTYSRNGSAAAYSNAYTQAYPQYSYPANPNHPASATQQYQLSPYEQATVARAAQPLEKQAAHSEQVLTKKPETESRFKDVKVVFDRVDLSMEELRAQLPRYKVS